MEHVSDQAVRGGRIEYWECKACGTIVKIPSPLTSLLFTAIGLFFLGTALLSDRFSGSDQEILAMRVGLGTFGLALFGWAFGKRRWLERRFPPVDGDGEEAADRRD